MKKSLIIILLLIVCSFIYGQTPVVAIESSEWNILYRGYPNKIIPAVTNNDSAKVILGGEGVTIEKSPNSEYYIVKPEKGKEAVLYVILDRNGILDTIQRKKYRVQLLPDPTLYWGAAKASEKANLRTERIFAKYPPEIPINATFIVESWMIITSKDTISGIGNDLKEAEKILKKIDSQSIVKIETKVKGPDDIIRTIEGTWRVNPWRDERDPGIIIQSGG
jgi:predicted small secreted protein